LSQKTPPNRSPLIDHRGRGAQSNETGRFHRNKTESDFSDYGFLEEDETSLLRTEFLKDSSRTIITENKSPDIPFRYSLNAYRGCEHGCAYCYARPTHEYLGLSAGLDFESRIFVKESAPELLREKLMSKSWVPDSITMSGVTDCYQPAERKFELTRRCLQVFAEFLNPVAMITKNQLILRDIDLLQELAKYDCAVVFISVTTLDTDLARTLEPRTSSPAARLRTIEALARAGVPVGVNIAPVIPGLTDHEMPLILKAASEAGAKSAGYTPLRLPLSVNPIFQEWLEANRPERKERVLSAIRSIRGGELNSSEFGSRMRGSGAQAENMRTMFHLFKRKYRLDQSKFKLSTEHFRRPGDQLSLF
jgi:DNA repair photolyase